MSDMSKMAKNYAWNNNIPGGQFFSAVNTIGKRMMIDIDQAEYLEEFEAIEMLLDLVKQAPKTGDIVDHMRRIMEILEHQCHVDNWLVPVLRRLKKEKHEGYPIVALNVALVESQRSAARFSLIGPAFLDKISAVLDCCEDSRPKVKEVGMLALRECRSLPDGRPAPLIENIAAWRAWLKDEGPAVMSWYKQCHQTEYQIKEQVLERARLKKERKAKRDTLENERRLGRQKREKSNEERSKTQAPALASHNCQGGKCMKCGLSEDVIKESLIFCDTHLQEEYQQILKRAEQEKQESERRAEQARQEALRQVERERQESQRLAEQEQRRIASLKEKRKSAHRCIMCGLPLNFLARMLSRESKHKSCAVFID